MLTSDIRTAYLDFFAKKHGHAVIAGASLIPENDPTVLFTTAGMHPLVPYLLGESHPAGKRLVDVQRCVRTQDIDEVGDASHLTCFEMLGNWSLGDYFKKESIAMSYEFLTEVLGIDPTMLAVTCFAGDSDAPKDEESAQYWMSHGIPADRIGFLPKEDNWWGPAGSTGPCGPDTEIFYWVGKGEPHGNPAENPGDWMEIWNNVFLQYDKKSDGTFEPLKQKCVDTGMGLERIAMVLQGVSNVYDIDTLRPIIDDIFSLSQGGRIAHVRIIADHIRAATFIIADGVSPSNIGQGYILRRLIRRAIRSARTLGIDHAESLTSSVASIVIAQFGSTYPHLTALAGEIRDVLRAEELQFGKTIQEGVKHFERSIGTITDGKMDGQTAFHLYDTYGFPLELTKEMAAEQGIGVDEEGFRKAFEAHQALSRAGAEQKFKGGLADHSAQTTKLHTATHLLNAALRRVLGDHVQQKGSNITAERLRFDFNHPDKMTPEQLSEVERLVNEAISADLPVSYRVMSVEEAKSAGSVGVFEEKYAKMTEAEGSEHSRGVKVYRVGGQDSSLRSGFGRQAGLRDQDVGLKSQVSSLKSQEPFSMEICGGPHIARTGMLGNFRILKEESSGAGVRRIKAVIEGGPEEIEVAGEEEK